jgi:hypothetical protein
MIDEPHGHRGAGGAHHDISEVGSELELGAAGTELQRIAFCSQHGLHKRGQQKQHQEGEACKCPPRQLQSQHEQFSLKRSETIL